MHHDELWQEYDYNGQRLGSIPQGTYAEKTKLFGGVAIMLYRFNNGDVEFLFQHRSKFVDRNPEKWDVSAGGHINFEEDPLDSAVRETREEIGVTLEPKKLELAAGYVRENRNLIYLYFYDWTGKTEDFCFDDKEVSEVKWVGFNDLVNFWPNLKIHVETDPIFQTFLLQWTKLVREKYGNLDK